MMTAGMSTCNVTRQRYRGVVKSRTYRSATTNCTGKVIRQTIYNYLQYHCLLNFTIALAILTEQRDFVGGAGVGQSCGCETAQGNQHGIRSQQTVTGRGQGSGL